MKCKRIGAVAITQLRPDCYKIRYRCPVSGRDIQKRLPNQELAVAETMAKIIADKVNMKQLDQMPVFKGEGDDEMIKSSANVNDANHGTFKLISTSRKTVTPTHAKEFLKFNTIREQSLRLRDRHISFLSGAMLRGEFRLSPISFAKTPSGRRVLVNGQHTLHAIIKCGIAQQLYIEEYEVSNEAALGLLYAQFDPAFASRNAAHLAMFNASQLGLKWRAKIAKLLPGALGFIKGGPGVGGNMSANDKVRMMADAIPDGDFMDEIIPSANKEIGSKILARLPVAAAMIKTRRVDENAARVFWSSVRDGIGLTKNSPELMLREYLAGVTTGYTSIQTGRRGVSPEEIYRKSIRAWNAYRAGERLSVLRMPGQREEPI